MEPLAGPVLGLYGISKAYPGVLANDDVTVELRRGEILGLLGENGAGKTTLMNIVSGRAHPDRGRIVVGGEDVHVHGPQHARRLGIGMVHQHFMLVPTMTVAENVTLGTHSRRPPIADTRDVARRLQELSVQYGLHVDVNERVEDLALGEQQRAEILRLLFHDADILIFDEPTAVLTPQEWEELEKVFRGLAARGKSIIFITHKLDELLAVADRCTVMRDGRVVRTVTVGEVSKQELARLMVGRDVVLRVERPRVEPGDVVLDVRSLSLLQRGRRVLEDVSLHVRRGEVLGVAGVGGNGQDELIDVLCGVLAPTAGTIRIGPDERPDLTPKEFIDAGGAVIPADRHRAGLVLELTVRDNLMLADFAQPPYAERGIVRPKAVTDRCRELIQRYGIRTPSAEVLAHQLSGGNQQKVVFAREMERRPRLILAAQPTRGLDVGAVEFVYGQLNAAKRDGAAILLVSTELDEILSLSDRIAVMYEGRIVGMLDTDHADAETLGLLMSGQEASAA